MSPHSIKPSDVGKRVTLQYFGEDGSRHEVVGLLERTEVRQGQPILHVRRRDDSVVHVPLRRIKAGRVITKR